MTGRAGNAGAASETARPRVAIVCPGVGREQRGFERLFRDLFDELRGRADVTLFKGGGPGAEGEVRLRFVARNSRLARIIPVHALAGRTPIHTECLTFALALLPHLRSGRYDIVHCIDPPLTRLLFKMRAALGLKFRLLYTEGTSMPARDAPPCDHTHFLAPGAMRAAAETGAPAERMTLIPAGIHPERFEVSETRESLRRRHGAGERTFVILCVAAINRVQKRIDHLIEEVATLDGDVLLWLDGSMDQGDPSLLGLARERLGERCRITRVESSNVGELYALADVMVLASLFEAFGLVIVEAQSAGAAVITHDSEHFRWLAPNPAAHVDMRARGALAARLRELRERPEEIEGLRCAAETRERFAWRSLAPRYLDLYRLVMSQPERADAAGGAPQRRFARQKSALIHRLRVSGLLTPAEAARYWIKRATHSGRNRAFRRAHPDFRTPPPHLTFDAMNHADWPLYHDSGVRHAGMIAGVILHESPGETLDVLEWGCGPGRLIRHMRAALAPRRVTLTGTDYNPESVAWCRANLPGIDFVENGLMPPLPLPSDRFDAVYCFSVFTHLSEEAQRAWSGELLRVLRPGGLLVCTTHGDRCRHMLFSHADLARYNAGHVVIQGGYREGRKWFLSMHPPAAVREWLLKGYADVRLASLPEYPEVIQDVWTARKPA